MGGRISKRKRRQGKQFKIKSDRPRNATENEFKLTEDEINLKQNHKTYPQ